jgi:tetratricopeptide (TPR) repeat protein
MAEELNGRGAMELAVPFYRQTIALLLAEREQWRSLPGETPVALQASADVEGVIAAALQVEAGKEAMPESELLRQLAALDEELTLDSFQEVAAALDLLQEQWGEPHGQLLGLQAKLQLLLGDLEAARQLLERALVLDSSCIRLRMNAGAARLASGDARGAVELLRPLIDEHQALETLQALGSFWNNLAQAELQLGEMDRLVEALQAWLAQDPLSVDATLWRDRAQQLYQAGDHNAASRILRTLAEQGGPEQRRAVLADLAELLEAGGRYRDAALLYRELLRPAL